MSKPARWIAAVQPVEATRGDDLDMPWTITRIVGDVKQTVDVSTWVFTAQLRYNPNVEPALADFAITTTYAATGLIIVSLTRAQTQILPAQVLHWDMQRVVNNKTRTIVGGTFTVDPDTTRP